MSTIKELREEQARIATNARAKFDEIKDDTPEDRAADINREFDAMMADHDKIGARIERMSKLEAAERAGQEAEEAEERARREAKRPNGTAEARGIDEGDAPSYAVSFRKWLANGGDKSALSGEERAALEQGYRAKEDRAQTTSAAAGGYTIPEEFRPELVRSMLAWGPMYDPGVTRELITSGGNPMPFPTVDDTGSTAEAAPNEGTTLTDDGGKDVTFGEKSLGAYSYDTEWIRVSLELSQDSAFNMGAVIGSLLGERLGRIANLMLTTGNGSTQPNGVVTASSAGKTSAAGGSFTADDVIDLVHSVDPAYRTSPGVRFMFNDTTLSYIRKLKDGQGNYLWQMGDVRNGQPDRLLGYNYSINQAVPGFSTASPPAGGQKIMLFGDFQKYWVRKISGFPLIGAIQDKDFWPGFGIAGYLRLDGELADAAAVKHLVTGS